MHDIAAVGEVLAVRIDQLDLVRGRLTSVVSDPRSVQAPSFARLEALHVIRGCLTRAVRDPRLSQELTGDEPAPEPAPDARGYPRDDSVRHPRRALVRFPRVESEVHEQRVFVLDDRLAGEAALKVGVGEINQPDPRRASPVPGVGTSRARPRLRQTLHEQRHRPALVREESAPRRSVLSADDGARAVGVDAKLVVEDIGDGDEREADALQIFLRGFRRVCAADSRDEHVIPRDELHAALNEAGAERGRRERFDFVVQPVGLDERIVILLHLRGALGRRVPGAAIKGAHGQDVLSLARCDCHTLDCRV